MIRINLLPFRAARKRENIRKEISVYFLCVVFLILVMIYLQFSSSSQLDTLMTEERAARSEFTRYAKNNRLAARIKKQIKEVRDRLNVIQELEKQRGGPLELLKEVAFSVPPEKLWLQSIAESGGTLTIHGTGMDNDTVALFMTNLEKAASITSVDLKNTQLQDFPQFKQKASGFAITCKTALLKEPPPSGQKKKSSKRRR